MNSALLYVRVSSKEQEREGYSLDAQEKLGLEYALRNNLKIIDTLFESTARLIASKDSIADTNKRKIIESITKTLRGAVE